MLFTSFRFFIFFAALLIVYYVVPRNIRWGVLLLASMVFCWSFNRLLTLHIIAAALVSWGAGAFMARSFEREKEAVAAVDPADREAKKRAKAAFRKARRGWLAAALVLLFGSLLQFKFYNPFADLLTGRGLTLAHIAVPVGISFYTLLIASYLLDVYNKNQTPEPSFARFLLFASWFPGLLQGPICRYAPLAKELRCENPFAYNAFVSGFARVLGGFAKKLILADRLAVLTEALYSNYTQYAGAAVAFAGVAYAVQLYCDFSGGIDMALGFSKMLGVEMPENFRRPYFSRSVSEYWRRWHSTLGAWLKDYVFYSLSLSSPMNKLGKALRAKHPEAAKRLPPLLSMAVLWLCSAVWHGEGTQFLLWGLFHWCLVTVDTLTEARVEKRLAARQPLVRNLIAVLQTVLTFACVSFGELIFRAQGLNAALYMIGALFRGWSTPFSLSALGLELPDLAVAVLGVILLFALEFMQERGRLRNLPDRIAASALPVRWAVLLVGIALVALLGVYGAGYDPAPFLYFQF